MRTTLSLLTRQDEKTIPKSVAKADALLSNIIYDVIILDGELADGYSDELLPTLKKTPNQPITIIFSAAEPKKEISEYADAVLIKSRTSNTQLINTIQDLVLRKKLN